MLCNLTKKEYVHKEEIIEHGKAGFGGFLLSRICWGSGSISMQYGGGLNQGEWAGNRFEITTMDRISGGLRGWKDVGEEPGDVMAEIWESDQGPDWQTVWQALLGY